LPFFPLLSASLLQSCVLLVVGVGIGTVFGAINASTIPTKETTATSSSNNDDNDIFIDFDTSVFGRLVEQKGNANSTPPCTCYAFIVWVYWRFRAWKLFKRLPL
jgi:hypothetical protein